MSSSIEGISQLANELETIFLRLPGDRSAGLQETEILAVNLPLQGIDVVGHEKERRL